MNYEEAIDYLDELDLKYNDADCAWCHYTHKAVKETIRKIYDDFEIDKFEKPFISKGKDLQKNINMYIDEDKTYEVCLRVIEE